MENRVRTISYASSSYRTNPMCELEWKHLVHNEIISVTSAMRKNARWAGVSVGSLGDLGLTMGLRKADSFYLSSDPSSLETSRVEGQSPASMLPTSRSNSSLNGNPSLMNQSSPVTSRGSNARNVYGSANAMNSSDGRYRNRQSPLMQSFSNLRTILATVENVCDMDALVLLTPFLDVIHSGDTSGPITGAALSSVEKFLTYGIVGPDSINLPAAMSALAAASTHCKFEATDSDSDDVVLLKILHVLRIALTSECGAVLADQSVCMMIETALSMCCQGRLSEMLRRSAEHTLTVMVQTLFGRLQDIDSSSAFKPTAGSTCGDDLYRLRSDHSGSSPTYREKISETGTFLDDNIHQNDDNAVSTKRSFDMGLERKNTFENQQIPVLHTSTNISPRPLEVNTAPELWSPQNSNGPESIRDRIPVTPQPITDYAPDAPYGLPSIRELLRVLISFTNPHNHNHTESVRLMSLNILNVALEVGGKSLGRDSLWCEDDEEIDREIPAEGGGKPVKKVGEKRLLRDMILDDLCKNLFQLARTESIPLLTLTLRVTTTIFHTLRPYLKLQQELFLLFLLERADPPAWKQKRLEIMPELDVRQDRYFDKEPEEMSVQDRVDPSEGNNRPMDDNEKKDGGLETPNSESAKIVTEAGNSNPASATPSSPSVHNKSPSTKPVLRRSLSNPVSVRSNGTERPPSSRGLRSAYANESTSRTSRSIPPGPAPATGEVRELLLECLGQFVRVPSFMADLWLNYDCDVGCENMFEEIIGFLCRNCFPNSTAYSTATAHILCLDSLLLFLRYVVERGIKAEITNETIAVQPKIATEPPLTILMNDSMPIRSDISSDSSKKNEQNGNDEEWSLPTAEHLMESRVHKEILLEGAKRFNKKPKDGIAFLQERGLLPPHPIPEKNMAQFLLSTPKLDKKLMGEYLCKPSHVPLLRAFLDLFDFKGKRIDEALRLMLESFRLPGESQQIERIMEQFSDVYFNSGPVDIRNRDDTFLLSYSIIMLNTDLHNPQVRQRMSIEDYMKNLRGFEFTKEYLTSIYDAILKREIVMPEEHEGQLGFNYAWKELLKRSEMAGTLKTANTGMYDKDMFEGVWHTIISALYYAFHRAQDDVTLQKAIACFNYCAQIASHHGLPEVTDHLIFSLSKITGLHEASDDLSRPTNDRTVDLRGEGKITVSALSNRLGNSYKGQVAMVVMFGIASENGNMLQESWKTILEIVRNLFRHSLLPMSMFQVEDFLCGTIPIPRAPKLAPPKPERNDGSLLSALSSYLLSPYSSYDASRAEPTEEEIEFAKSAMECIGACKLEEVFADIRFLEEEALQHLMRAILYVSSATTDSTPAPTNGRTRPYDASLVFFLELMVNITIQNRDRIQFLWPIVFEHLSGILAQASSLSILLTERAVVGLLRLCIRLAHKEEMIDEVFKSLDLLLALPPDVLNSTAEQMMAGILNLVKSDTEHIRGKTQWETIFSLLSTTSTHPEASKYSFQAVSILVAADAGAYVTEDNFGEVVDILISFAAAGAGFNSDNQDKSNRSSPKVSRNVRVLKNSNASVDRAMKAVEQLYGLHTRADMLIKGSGMKSDSAWSTYWLPILSGLSQQCYHPCRDVRQHALTYLQRALLLPDLLTDDVEDWGMSFYHVLFPLLEELLKPEVFLLDPQGMDETRMRVSGLLCKIFLHHLPRLLGWPGLVDLWIKILRFMDLYMHAGENDYLFEAVPESLKNMLLVMSTSGVFFTGLEQTQLTGDAADETSNRLIQQRKILWDTTWKQVSKFLPTLKDDLFPTEERPLKSTLPEPSKSPLESKSDTKIGGEIDVAEGVVVEVKEPVVGHKQIENVKKD